MCTQEPPQLKKLMNDNILSAGNQRITGLWILYWYIYRVDVLAVAVEVVRPPQLAVHGVYGGAGLHPATRPVRHLGHVAGGRRRGPHHVAPRVHLRLLLLTLPSSTATNYFKSFKYFFSNLSNILSILSNIFSVYLINPHLHMQRQTSVRTMMMTAATEAPMATASTSPSI